MCGNIKIAGGTRQGSSGSESITRTGVVLFCTYRVTAAHRPSKSGVRVRIPLGAYASMAQWQSSCLVSSGLRVQVLLEAPYFRSSTAERLAYIQRVSGSNPDGSTSECSAAGACLIWDQEVAGSSPAIQTNA